MKNAAKQRTFRIVPQKLWRPCVGNIKELGIDESWGCLSSSPSFLRELAAFLLGLSPSSSSELPNRYVHVSHVPGWLWPADGISWPDHRWPHGYGLAWWQRGLGWAHYSPILAPWVRSGSALGLPDVDVTGIYSLFLEWVVLCHLDQLTAALQDVVILVEEAATSHSNFCFWNWGIV